MKIEKIGENRIRVTKTKKLYDKTNKTKFIEVDDEPFEIGITGITEQKEALQAQIDYLNDPAKRATQIAALQTQLDELDLIEQELNK